MYSSLSRRLRVSLPGCQADPEGFKASHSNLSQNWKNGTVLVAVSYHLRKRKWRRATTINPVTVMKILFQSPTLLLTPLTHTTNDQGGRGDLVDPLGVSRSHLQRCRRHDLQRRGQERRRAMRRLHLRSLFQRDFDVDCGSPSCLSTL